MIFVTLGTQDKPFNRLLVAVEKAIDDGFITDDVVVQVGFTKFKSDKMKVFDLIGQEDFASYMKQADLLITHGGVGSIITGLNLGKKIIAAPRLAKYGEHVNDHQLQIIKCFWQKKYILPLYEFEKLGEVLQAAKDFVPERFESNKTNFLNRIEKMIDSI